MKKDSYPWIYDESISLFFLKKRCKDYWFWHRFNKNCKCTMQKIRNCVWVRFYSKFYWKRIEQIQIVEPECDGIWNLKLVYKLFKKILHKISQFKTTYASLFFIVIYDLTFSSEVSQVPVCKGFCSLQHKLLFLI